MLYEYVIVGCGVSGIMAAAMIKKRTNNFIVLEKTDTIGGVWETISKDETRLQHNSCLYLLDSFFYVPGEPVSERYADRNFICKRLDKFIQYNNLDQHLEFDATVTEFYESRGDIVKIKYIQNDTEYSIKSRNLLICTGNLSVSRTLNQKKVSDDTNNEKNTGEITRYSNIKNYKDFFRDKKSVVVIGSGASGVEVCVHALENGLNDIVMLYRGHLGFYFNGILTEYLFTILHLLPRNIADYIFMKLQYMIAWMKGYRLPSFIGTGPSHIYPFSTNIIDAYNNGKIVFLENKNISEKRMLKYYDAVVETVGFDNSLKQFGIDSRDLYNLNTRHPAYRKVFFAGLAKPNTGTVAYTSYILLSNIMQVIDKGLYDVRSSVDDVIFTPKLYMEYYIDMGLSMKPFFDIIKFWIHSMIIKFLDYINKLSCRIFIN